MKRIGKDFDCVEMKNAIQARLVSRRRHMNANAFAADIEKTLSRSPAPIAGFWRQISARKSAATRDRVIAGRH